VCFAQKAEASRHFQKYCFKIIKKPYLGNCTFSLTSFILSTYNDAHSELHSPVRIAKSLSLIEYHWIKLCGRSYLLQKIKKWYGTRTNFKLRATALFWSRKRLHFGVLYTRALYLGTVLQHILLTQDALGSLLPKMPNGRVILTSVIFLKKNKRFMHIRFLPSRVKRNTVVKAYPESIL